MKATILLVEDNLVNMELVTDLLEANGFKVVQARSGEEGVRLAGELKPDLVLMDLSLPRMDGLAATHALKSNPAIRHLPVIALTAHAMGGDEKRALAAGCDGYLTKPIDTRAFPGRIAAFLNSAEARCECHCCARPATEPGTLPRAKTN